MAPATPAERLMRIVEDGLCIGCGICEPIAGAEAVRVTLDSDGAERPRVIGELSEAAIDEIERVCPGLRIEGLPRSAVGTGTTTDRMWGVYEWMRLAWAGDPDIRHRASTGGALSALAAHAIESARVAFVWHVGVGDNPAGGTPVLSFTTDDVIAASGSRYGPAAPLRPLEQVLARGEPFAFIGKPCDVNALRNRAEYDSRIDALCRYRLVMVCGGFMEPAAVTRFFASEGIAADRIANIRYRGHGCPGPTRVETVDGAVREWDYLDFWGEDESAWSVPFRCKICPDGIGEAADVAAADTWPGGSPTRDGQVDDLGTNALIVRTEAGIELVESAAVEGRLVLGASIGPGDMDSYQPHQVAKKEAGWARIAGLRRSGSLAPRTARLRLADLAREQSVSFLLDQSRGTRSRAPHHDR